MCMVVVMWVMERRHLDESKPLRLQEAFATVIGDTTNHSVLPV